ncbi:MAG: formylglycine-generating enzyme family protein [Calditrichaeota bacterium]|nr:formylglycine-generating enzyme family protein [Calditrichota bacterium]MBT7617844.1 formylglycine-generating enzyme family protein [Calditrichota bacterium]MBT7788567.1 formylglycine-generating enzyme family protein [Calditrichota bacterium]
MTTSKISIPRILLLALSAFLLSCSHEQPTETPRDNPLDGRNPEVVPRVLSITTDFDGGFTNDLNPKIYIETELAYMVRYQVVQSVNSALNSPWQTLITSYSVDMSDINGEKIIGCQALALNGNTSAVVFTSIRLDTRAVISSFNWTATNEDSIIVEDQITFTLVTEDDALGNESGGTAYVEVEGWEQISLDDNGDGTYSFDFTVKEDTPLISDAQVSVYFVDRVGNVAQPVTALKSLTVWWTYVPGSEKTFPLGGSGESIVMCWIPPGEFLMGRQDDEQDSFSSESPQHPVFFSDGFWIGKYELTQGQWEAVMGDNPSHFIREDHPVEQVSWNDVQSFESTLENSFRLPSESEWEYACRAGTTTRFYWGDDETYVEIDNFAHYDRNDTEVETHPIGQKLPNAWGLYDMSGNIYEWCEDWYHNNYIGAPADGSARLSEWRNYRVGRGGCWDSHARECRSAFRNGVSPHNRSGNLGFRLVKDR